MPRLLSPRRSVTGSASFWKSRSTTPHLLCEPLCHLTSEPTEEQWLDVSGWMSGTSKTYSERVWTLDVFKEDEFKLCHHITSLLLYHTVHAVTKEPLEQWLNGEPMNSLMNGTTCLSLTLAAVNPNQCKLIVWFCYLSHSMQGWKSWELWFSLFNSEILSLNYLCGRDV